ncbi:MAG: hypothetical protein KKA60_09105 [Proteobacteria bacterium]|nr:hypothetical protein [Pseudomonadota bacterium]
MRNLARRASLVFAAGAVGGFANSVVLFLFGQWGVPGALGVSLAPGWSWHWLYPRLVWGGIWGALFLILPGRGRVWSRGLTASLFPTLIQLLVVFPILAHKGIFGLELGAATPLFVVLYNAVWGLAAAGWLRYLRE